MGDEHFIDLITEWLRPDEVATFTSPCTITRSGVEVFKGSLGDARIWQAGQPMAIINAKLNWIIQNGKG